MPIPEFQVQSASTAAERFLEKRRPRPEIRHELDIKVEIENGVVTISELRPQYKKPSVIQAKPFARIKWVGTKRHWKLYWMRASGKWELYEPKQQASAIGDLFDEIVRDPHRCFFG